MLIRMIGLITSLLLPLALLCGKTIYRGENLLAQVVADYYDILMIAAIFFFVYCISPIVYPRRPPRLD